MTPPAWTLVVDDEPGLLDVLNRTSAVYPASLVTIILRRRDSLTRRARSARLGGIDMDELAIRGGLVVDGTGAPGREADVFVNEGRVVAVEPRSARTARRVIDARGQVVAPGFID